jgi:hypothetical protein
MRHGGRKHHAEIQEWVKREAERDGFEPLPPQFSLDSVPEHGMSRSALQQQREYLVDELMVMQGALAVARGWMSNRVSEGRKSVEAANCK